MKIDLRAHYGFASLPAGCESPGEGGAPSASTGEGGNVGAPLMALQRLNSKIGGTGEGGPFRAGRCERDDSGALLLTLHRLNSKIGVGGEGGPVLAIV
jgi:hypothetical protein